MSATRVRQMTPDPVPPPAFEPHYLELESRPERSFVTIMVRREDKEAFDALQMWLAYREGRRVTQWEMFNLVLAEAAGAPGSRFRRASATA